MRSAVPPLRRLADWPALFIAFLASRQTMPFAWGSNDCVAFAADDVLAITGTDPLSGLRGAWDDEPQATALLRRKRGLAGAVTGRLGPPLPTPRLAQRGDVLIVVARHAVGAAPSRFLAVCDADRWAAPHRGGLARGPMEQAVRAWGVGHA